MDSEAKGSGYGGIESGTRVVAKRRSMSGCDVVLRFLSLALSLAAAVVLGVNKETKMVSVTLVSSLPPISIPATAKWNYLSAFTYLVVANSIACGYAAISLALTLANRDGTKKWITILISILDLIMVALLFSAIGAAGAIGLMGYHGNSHVQWKKVCNVFDKFCSQTAASLGLSAAAAVAFFLLVVLATYNLHKRP
ncbi:hypothetical protein SASPL_103746 [Salvia splendens]|uniref:CASP-like protein n=1 Tax=Salvia splendens TaxID=180675 RepID=A0A8X8YKA9_SALSN|nr:CASP-like protein 1E2 [Salvia splendens]KAG6432172.1 hypothetical protein SASPL_103746 [Salvia splendens]